MEEYGKATLFDYSYRYFYNDGYGKDYRIMNMSSWDDEEKLNMYLTAYLLCLYEQTLSYEASPLVKNRFLIARPLGIFVGGSVNAVRTVRGKQVSRLSSVISASIMISIRTTFLLARKYICCAMRAARE